MFDNSRVVVFQGVEELGLPFDPVVGTGNEGLFAGLDLVDGDIGADCAGGVAC